MPYGPPEPWVERKNPPDPWVEKKNPPDPWVERKGPSPNKEAPWSGWNVRQGSELALSILVKKKKKTSSFVNSRDVFFLRRKNEALIAENEHMRCCMDEAVKYTNHGEVQYTNHEEAKYTYDHLEDIRVMKHVLPYPRTSSL